MEAGRSNGTSNRTAGGSISRLITRLLAISGANDPVSLEQSRPGERVGGYRVGIQIMIEALILMGAGYAALNHMLGDDASPFLLVLGPMAFSLAIVMIDLALIEKANQIRAERESKKFGFWSPRSLYGLLILTGMVMVRMPMAIINANFVAVIAVVWLLHVEVAQVLVDDAKEANGPKVAEITQQVDAGIAALKVDRDTKDQAVTLLVGSNNQPPTATVETMIGPYDRQIKGIESELTGLRDRLKAAEVEVAKHAQEMACEDTGVRCDEKRTGVAGKKAQWRLAQSLLGDATTLRDDLKKQIAERETALTAAIANRVTALKAQSDAKADEQRRHDTVLAAARQAADTASAAYVTTMAARQKAIAARLDETVGLVKPKAGLTAEIAALNKLSRGEYREGIFFYLKAMLVGLELAALFCALFWPPRRAASVRDYLDFVTDVEDAVFRTERIRRQRPPLDGYGNV